VVNCHGTGEFSPRYVNESTKKREEIAGTPFESLRAISSVMSEKDDDQDRRSKIICRRNHTKRLWDIPPVASMGKRPEEEGTERLAKFRFSRRGGRRAQPER